MKKNYILLFFIFVVSSLILYISCSDSSTNPPPGGEETVTTTISGTVLDESNAPVVGAEIKSAGQTAMTNASGGFTFSGIKVPKSRFVVNATKSGYFDGSFADAPKANGTSNIKIYLMQAGVTQVVNASTGGEATLTNGSKVKLNANIVTNPDGSAFTGNVNLSVGYLDPTSENFSNLIPGGDMQAQRTDNSSATLYSYGIIKVEMKKDDGTDLKIGTGKTSEITVDIPPSMEGTAPATIPLWHYDAATGLWKEEGTAQKQGDKYVGTVAHFSDWNCDTPEGTSTVRGLVVDCNTQPVPGISVKIGQAGAITGTDGKFERRVPANTAFEVQVLGTRNFGLTSTPVSVPSLTQGTIHDVGTLTVQCPVYVKGMIRCGSVVKFGQVVISWDGGYNSQYTDFEGKFRLPTATGKAAEISIYTFDNTYKNMNINTPSNPGDSLDLGEIQVCDTIQVGDNELTINGDGFNNQRVVFSGSDSSLVFGYYVPQTQLTYVWMYNITGQDTIYLSLLFNGESIGTATNVTMLIYTPGKYYLAQAGIQGSAANVNVTTYGGVGGLIEGTFTGTLIGYIGTQGTINISNGKFSVVRLVGQKQNEKAIKDKIPIEIRKKLKLK